MAGAASGPLGGPNNPIPRSDFNDIVLEICVELDDTRKIVKKVKEGSGMQLYTKVAPTLVLYPRSEELDDDGNPRAPGMRGEDDSGTSEALPTILKDKEGKAYFQEALPNLYGKALLLNFCSPSVELYPKDKKGCEDIYELGSVDHDHIPAAALHNDDAFRAEIERHGKRMVAQPLKQPELKYTFIRSAMVHYQRVLKRENVGGCFGSSGWRMAWNKKGKVLAVQLTSKDIYILLGRLRSDLQLAALGGLAYRMESWGGVPFKAGDYLIIDLAETPHGHALKFDKHNEAVVRTVNEESFEYTYAQPHGLVGLTLG